ncbi:MAG: HEAT repeat domain-containing protein [Spirochaetes bacterium]|nr:HEAT repeat domain-containing protein [Spirochaetota bacterium]
MNLLQNLFSSDYTLLMIIAAAAVTAFVIAFLIKFSGNRKFKRSLDCVFEDKYMFETLIQSRYDKNALYKKSGLIEKYAAHKNIKVIKLLGIDDIWIEKLFQKNRKKDFNRVLKYASSTGLFICFLVCLRKKRYLPLLIQWLEKSGDMLYLRRIALSGKGEQFDGALAGKIFKDKISQIREMTGDPEWAPRYFAVKVLMHEKDDLSKRALHEMINDSHPLIRRTLAREFQSEDRKKFYSILYNMMLHDSSEEVRYEAWKRITGDFPDLFNPVFKDFTESEKLHYISFLRDGVETDINLAMIVLDQDNLELRYIAALYLNRNKHLSKLLEAATFADMKSMDRVISLLKKSCEVNVTDFLECTKSAAQPGSLYICSILLQEFGNRENINNLAIKVFSLYTEQTELDEVFINTLKCISERGNEKSYYTLKSELEKRKDSTKSFELILDNIPVKADYIFIDYLFDLFTDSKIQSREYLRKALLRFNQDLILPRAFEIVKSERSRYNYTVRKEGLRLLGELKADYCLETILESLPVFSPEEAREFFIILKEYPKKLFLEKISEMLKTNDSKVRASLIAVLPVTGETSFIKQIDSTLKDADPDVRISCVWALTEYGETNTVHHSMDLLRDPVERVRISAAEAIGIFGSKKAISELKTVLFDSNEVDSVKEAVLKGLSASKTIDAVDVMVEFLETETDLKDIAIEALSNKSDSKSLIKLIENFKDGTPELRQIISEVFKRMERSSEKYLDDVVHEEIGSLKPYLAEILDATGYVESKIRKLAHRSPQIRRSAAEFLSLIGSKPAFRGIVLASRDPDEEVRVKVIKALEKLETKDGREILNSLINDPDTKVRKYTKWALERLKAKSL